MIKRYWQKGRKQKVITVLSVLVLLILIFVMRDDYQPALLFLRKFIFIILVAILFLVFTLSKFRRAPSTGRRLLILVGIIAFFTTGWYFGFRLHLYQFMQSYNIFNDLNRVEMHELPLTQNERIHAVGEV